MNKKGFTLVEVLGVIVIILALGLLVIPNMINKFSNKKSDINKVHKQLIVDAAKMYVSDNSDELSDYKTYCLDINSLIEKKYLSEKKDAFNNEDYADTHKVKVTIGKPYEYEVVENNQCDNSEIYATGSQIQVAGIDFYIISNHDDYVVALKATPLTVPEINLYGGVGTDDNHVNMYVYDFYNYYQRAYGCLNGLDYFTIDDEYDYNDPRNDYSCQSEHDWGKMAYYASATCNENKYSGCTTSYDASEIKYAVNAWQIDKFKNNELKEVNGYKSRLITKEELINDLNCTDRICNQEWISNSSFSYWTMSEVEDSKKDEVYTLYNTIITESAVYLTGDRLGAACVRPVINVKKSAIQSIES